MHRRKRNASRLCLIGLVFSFYCVSSPDVSNADHPELTRAISALNSSDSGIRMSAVETIARFGPLGSSATQPLLKLAETDNLALRNECLVALGQIGPAAAQAVPMLRSTLQESSIILQHSAITALRRIGPGSTAALPELRQMSQTDEPLIAVSAAWAVVRLSDEDSGASRRQIPVFLSGLGDSDDLVVHEAILGLVEIGAPAIPALIRTTKADREQLRIHACDALAGMQRDAEPSVSALIPLTRDTSTEVRWHAIHALGEIRSDAARVVPVLIRAMESGDAAIRRTAIESLGDFGPESASAVPGLQKILDGQDPELQLLAAESLGKIGPAAAAAVPSLDQAVVNGEGALTLNAVEALGRIGKPAIPVLVRHLDEEALRPLVLMVLGGMGPEAATAVDALSEFIESPDLAVRVESCLALAQIGPAARKAVPQLISALQKSREGSGAAAYALAKLEAQQAVPVLRKALASNQENLRLASAWALISLNPDDDALVEMALPELRKALQSPNQIVRLEVAELLGQLGSRAESAATGLRQLAQTDPDPTIRSKALHSLAMCKISDPSLLPLAEVALATSDPNLRNTGCFVAAKLGEQAGNLLPEIRQQLRSPVLFDRGVAAWALLRISPTPDHVAVALPILASVADHPDPRVRSQIASSLIRHRGVSKDADAALEKLQDDSNPEVRKAAGAPN